MFFFFWSKLYLLWIFQILVVNFIFLFFIIIHFIWNSAKQIILL